MFKSGDFFQVIDRGHVGRIVAIVSDKVFVEWEHLPGKEYDYLKYQAFPLWEATNKTFKNLPFNGI